MRLILNKPISGKKKTVTTYVKKIRMGMAANPVRQEGEEEEEGGEGQMDQRDQHVARYRPSFSTLYFCVYLLRYHRVLQKVCFYCHENKCQSCRYF
jgi:hypothetical protein